MFRMKCWRGPKQGFALLPVNRMRHERKDLVITKLAEPEPSNAGISMPRVLVDCWTDLFRASATSPFAFAACSCWNFAVGISRKLARSKTIRRKRPWERAFDPTNG